MDHQDTPGTFRIHLYLTVLTIENPKEAILCKHVHFVKCQRVRHILPSPRASRQIGLAPWFLPSHKATICIFSNEINVIFVAPYELNSELVDSFGTIVIDFAYCIMHNVFCIMHYTYCNIYILSGTIFKFLEAFGIYVKV